VGVNPATPSMARQRRHLLSQKPDTLSSSSCFSDRLLCRMVNTHSLLLLKPTTTTPSLWTIWSIHHHLRPSPTQALLPVRMVRRMNLHHQSPDHRTTTLATMTTGHIRNMAITMGVSTTETPRMAYLGVSRSFLKLTKEIDVLCLHQPILRE
jgi:hypothetical protein